MLKDRQTSRGIETLRRTAKGCGLVTIKHMGQAIDITLDAIIVAVTEARPRLLTVVGGGEANRVPSGPLDATGDPTLELGLRRLVAEQTGHDVGYVEQLYTFGDADRARAKDGPRLLSIAYLALVREAKPRGDAHWMDWYTLLPWEDHREGRPGVIDRVIRPALEQWAGRDAAKRARANITFGLDAPWDPIRSLERYELLYEAGLVAEAYLDRGDSSPTDLDTGCALAVDHRRIAATALGRLRGKLTYRPVVFELLAEEFTLSQVQQTVEALSGITVHKQNFRRLIEQSELVEGTGNLAPSTGGRPAELFRFRADVIGERPRPGMKLPGLR